LNLPPEERSLDNPSFRIIDFGRGEHFRDHLVEWKNRRGSDSEVEGIKDFMRSKHAEQMTALRRMGFEKRDLGCWQKVCPV
jgi:hypothetical protein